MRPSWAWASATRMISSVIEVILMSICSAVMPRSVPGHLEVHVAEMILVAENVGEHGEALGLLDQAHGDAGDRPRQRHARHPSAPATSRTPWPSRTSRSISVISETTRIV